jgi:glutathione S-transferase
MTALRSLAVRISEAVVRWSSPARREWAEGLEREVAFIESDWRALGWAIGSTRVLLDRPEAPLDSLEAAVAEANSYLEKQQQRIQTFCFGVALLSAFVALLLLEVLHSLGRVCDGVVLVGLLYAIHSRYRSEMRKIGDGLGPYEVTAKYLAVLQRTDAAQRSWLHRLLAVLMVVQPVALMIYDSIHSHEWIGLLPILAVYAPCMLVLEAWNRVKRRRIHRRIAELDSLLARGPEGISV